ncbi:ParA family protein [Clostridium saccharobutylicum]|uniref:Chromosome partitioning protein ParA n=2 Tax=Clostridium saccharobutylicum TaxID=169679 RepID=U5MQH3_CLOSA|nr:ParA family protein [Clostridium saccharobutylicum]AGX43039.1 chromosome partitioning protein ParA [Clostridium saccharobutylicum DSM 13864]AQR90330.1 chromosome partitioning protein ParA [Clostridium saccharobutylicum]AQS00236.1 chromosome partitioning protein ParA [Clostridium saccharobutylicum]AQS10035.1 chromosome partitioning protein ParA [Clostridium saccharobutylicum]AQS14219.1 chromosome partitioning protein ParA [Clostridium saccharobutylicum]
MINEPLKYAVLNNKGGVGKSTISVHIAHGLALLGNKVLLIDMDGQNDASLFLGISDQDYKKTFYDLINKREDVELSECIINVRDNLDLLPSKHIDIINTEFYRESRIDLILKEKLQGINTMEYNYLIIDCGPQRSKVNDAVLCFVDNIIVPVQVESASVRAIGNIYEYLSDLRLNPEMIELIIPNMYDQRTSESRENMQLLKELFSESNFLAEPINRRVKITEAGKLGKTVYEYDKDSAKQFFKIVERLVSTNA